MNPEVKKIFVLFNELIQNQSDNILLPPCLKLPNSDSKAVPFRSEATSIGMKQRWLILKTI